MRGAIDVASGAGNYLAVPIALGLDSVSFLMGTGGGRNCGSFALYCAAIHQPGDGTVLRQMAGCHCEGAARSHHIRLWLYSECRWSLLVVPAR